MTQPSPNSPNSRPKPTQRKARPKRAIHGWINLDKPYDMTSTQAVGQVKWRLRPKKIGHAGTLDPLATGVLPLALGEATKTVAYMMDAQKTYHATITLGTQTDTDDLEGKVIASSDHRPDDADIAAALPLFTGEIQQVPPTYSAVHVNGERAYDLARSGTPVTLEPRTVTIEELRLVARPDADHLIIEVICGKGTYIRALARDLALHLGTVGHISALRRTQVGIFHADDAISLDDLPESVVEDDLSMQPEWLAPIASALDDIPAARCDTTQARQFRHGNSCFLSPHQFGEGQPYIAEDGSELYQVWQAQHLLGLAVRKGRAVHPLRVFNI